MTTDEDIDKRVGLGFIAGLSLFALLPTALKSFSNTMSNYHNEDGFKLDTQTMISIENQKKLFAEGQVLARRALLHATVISLCGTATFSLVVWAVLGFPNSRSDFRLKAASILPQVSRNSPNCDEENFSDILNYSDRERKDFK